MAGKESFLLFTVLGAAVVGFATAAFWVYYIKAVSENRPAGAAVADFFIMLTSSASLQAWLLTRGNFLVLAAWDLGSAVGTYYLVRRQKRSSR